MLPTQRASDLINRLQPTDGKLASRKEANAAQLAGSRGRQCNQLLPHTVLVRMIASVAPWTHASCDGRSFIKL